MKTVKTSNKRLIKHIRDKEKEKITNGDILLQINITFVTCLHESSTTVHRDYHQSHLVKGLGVCCTHPPSSSPFDPSRQSWGLPCTTVITVTDSTWTGVRGSTIRLSGYESGGFPRTSTFRRDDDPHHKMMSTNQNSQHTLDSTYVTDFVMNYHNNLTVPEVLR